MLAASIRSLCSVCNIVLQTQRLLPESLANLVLLCFQVEHYFQNVQTGHKSPCAREFVVEHKRELGEFRKRQALPDSMTEEVSVRSQERMVTLVQREAVMANL